MIYCVDNGYIKYYYNNISTASETFMEHVKRNIKTYTANNGNDYSGLDVHVWMTLCDPDTLRPLEYWMPSNLNKCLEQHEEISFTNIMGLRIQARKN